MHEELKSIIALWENLHTGDQLRKEAKARVERERHCGEILEASSDEAKRTKANLDKIKADERQVMRRLDSYRKRVKTTRTMIDTGTAPDYRLAETQLKSCLEIADDLETQALELWELREEAEEALQQATVAREQAQQALEQARMDRQQRLPIIRKEVAALDQARPALEAAIATTHKGAVRALRSRGRSLVSQMRDGACTLCNYGAPAQAVNEIAGHTRVHQCRNCARFLLPEPS